MDIKDLTHEQLNLFAHRLWDNKLLIDRAKQDAWHKLMRWTEEDADWRSNAYLQTQGPGCLQTIDQDPEVTISSEISSSGEMQVKAEWSGVFELRQQGIKILNAFGGSSIDHAEILETGEDLFYFEDSEDRAEH